VAKDSSNSEGEADACLSLAMIYLNQSEVIRAIELTAEARKVAESLSNPRLEAEAQFTLGTIYAESVNDQERSRAAFDAAKSIWQRMGNRLGYARASLAVTMIDFSMNRLDEGPGTAEQALTIFQSFGDKAGEAQAFLNIGYFNLQSGRKQDALNMYAKASPLVDGSGDLFTEASLLNNTARAHYDLGDVESALQFYEAALLKNQGLRDDVGVAYSLLVLGESSFAVGKADDALSYLNRAQTAFRDLRNQRMQAVVLGELGVVYNERGKNSDAMNALNESLELLKSIPDRRVEASVISNIGLVIATSGDHGRALSYYEKAIELNRETEDPFAEVVTLYRMANSFRQTGRLAEALSRSETAMRIIEGTRSGVISSSLRTSYFASVRQQYELYIDVLMSLYGRDGSNSWAAQAFEASERSRARTLLDTIAEARLSFTEGVDKKQLERESSLSRSIDTKAEQYRELLGTNAPPKVTADLENELRKLTAEYEELMVQMRIQSPRYAELVRPQPISLKEVQQRLLDSESLLLEYAFGAENSYLWAVTRESFSVFMLPKRSDLEAKARRVRELMTTRIAKPGEKPAEFAARIRAEEAQYAEAAAELSGILLGPVADRLPSRLVIVSEGVLQYLPFSALPSPKSLHDGVPEPLVKDHEIVYLPSASTLAVIRQEAPLRGSPDRTLAVFADPVFQTTDRRVTVKPAALVARPKVSTPATVGIAVSPNRSDVGGNALPRLPASAQEAKAIAAMVPEDRRFIALGFDATKAAASSPDLNRYKIVHFATHTVLNERHPDLSSLVMSLVDQAGKSQNGYLQVRDIYNLRLSAELVVLSACETALGKDVKGEGLMSMVRAFMYSGTPTVLASLWKVDDEATAELMTEFYKELLQNKRTPAAALRQAQITQMQKKSRQSPYFWAGFQLQGEWRP